MKRIISLALIIAMLLAIMPLSVLATEGTDGLVYGQSSDGTYYIVDDYTGSATSVEIPSTYNGLPVKEIGEFAFHGCATLESVELPDSITALNSFAFSYCSNLETIQLPASLKTICSEAFRNSGLTSIEIPDSVTVENAAFYECLSLTDVVIGDNVILEDSAFIWSENLENITVGNNITIGYYAFAREAVNGSMNFNTYDNALYLGNSENPYVVLMKAVSTDITDCEIHPDTEIIYGDAFVVCASLTSIDIPNSVKTIGEYAFSDCYGLENVTLNNNITHIGSRAFGFTSISKIVIPSSVSEMGDYVFDECEYLTDIYCEAEFQPEDWDDDWLGDCEAEIHWGCDFVEITKQPESVAVKNGNVATVTVTAIGDELTYQWYFKNAGASSFALTNSYKSNTYSVTMDDSRVGRQVYCVITDKYGNSVQTETVTLGMAVKIEIQPTTVAVPSGQKATVTVTASGEGLKYQWYVKNRGASTFSLTNSFKGTSYYVEMNGTRFGRQVYCVITDKYGNSVQTDTATLGMAVKIVTQPESVVVNNGEVATVTVKASGEKLTYKWYYKDTTVSKFYLTTSFTSDSYYIPMSSARMGRQVYCVITDKYGNSVQTDTVTLGMVVNIVTQPQNVAVQSGEKATVTVKASGEGLTYKWYFKEKNASSFSLTTSFKGDSYYVEMNGTRYGRQVYCVITDKYGNSVQTETVTLGMAVKIVSQPTSVSVANGATAKVTVKASGEGLTYKWYFKDKSASNFNLTTSFKSNTYSVAMSDARAGRQVYCVITDKYGNTQTTNVVTLNKK